MWHLKVTKVKDEYFDRYDGIYAEILQATSFDESTDLSTTYLGKMNMTRDQIKILNFWTRVYTW